MQQEIDWLKEQLKQRDDQAARLMGQVDQLMGQIDHLLKQQAESSKQQALLLSQIEKGSNASKLQSSEASGLSQVFEDQTLSQQSDPNTTSLAGNDDSQSNLACSITSNTSYEIELAAPEQPKKRRAVSQ
jgi:hypothetical protein